MVVFVTLPCIRPERRDRVQDEGQLDKNIGVPTVLAYQLAPLNAKNLLSSLSTSTPAEKRPAPIPLSAPRRWGSHSSQPEDL